MILKDAIWSGWVLHFGPRQLSALIFLKLEVAAIIQRFNGPALPSMGGVATQDMT